MHLYRYHFLDAFGAVTGRRSLRLSTDAAAVKVGQRMFADRHQDHAFEIWRLIRLVHSESRPRVAAGEKALR